MPTDDPKTLVSTGWLAERLGRDDIAVLDASWYLPTMARDARAEFAAGHIPGARFFDIDRVSDTTSSLPHMAPSPEFFAETLRDMGIGDGQQVVVYDGAGLYSAARVWWTFRLMGKTDIAVLDGGLPKWRAEGRAVVADQPPVSPRKLTVAPQRHLVRTAEEVLAVSRTAELVDARPGPRFRGEVAEPRTGLRSGHIPGAKSVPFGEVLNPDGTMKSPDALRAVFQDAGVDLSRPVVTSCGSGVTAAMLSLALERMGHRDHALYDGSWAEWGGRDDLPIEKG